MKKLLSALCALNLAAGMISSAFAAGRFDDVAQEAWYNEAVTYCEQEKLMVGVDEAHFAPEEQVTRGMFVTVLYRLSERPEVSGECGFVDVPAGSYYEQAVTWAAQEKIVFGMDETHFAPEQPITREEMACMLDRYAHAVDAPFLYDGIISELACEDQNLVSDYAEESVWLCLHKNLMYGDKEGTFRPQDTATRAEAAAVIMRLSLRLQRT